MKDRAQTSLLMSRALHKTLVSYARKHKMSLGETMRQLIRRGLTTPKKAPK